LIVQFVCELGPRGHGPVKDLEQLLISNTSAEDHSCRRKRG